MTLQPSASRPALLAGLMHFCDRRFSFDRPGNVAAATIAMVVLCGLLSLWLGQDANWDLRNYHLYNGYALLEGRLAHDFAPAQMQTYFSPALDVVHYLMMVKLPAPLAGFFFGGWHGLLFLPVSGIAWLALQGQANRTRLAPLLGVAGLCSGAFLSELGGSMADNSSALFVLASLYLVLRSQMTPALALRPGLRMLAVAGVMLGVAVALKLTNAIYALALAASMLCAAAASPRRLVSIAVLATAALLSAALVAGWWYWRVWDAFGNPLFPQFNALFQAPLAAPVAVADTRWLPRNLWEQLTWPLVFTFQPRRISEVSLGQCIWALLYLALVVAAFRALLRRGFAKPAFAPAMRCVAVFFLVAYLLWQVTFSIHRYLVALELLAPLVLWWLCRRLLPATRSQRWGGALLATCALVSVLGWNTWGQERWAWRGFAVEAPPMDEPAASVVLLVGGEPQSWRIPFLPAQARYVGVATNFPESAAFRSQIAGILQASDHQFAIFPSYSDKLALRFARMNGWVERLGFSGQEGCGRLRWLARTVRGLKSGVEEAAPGQCRLVPRSVSLDPAVVIAQERGHAQAGLGAYGLALDESTCISLSSRIGQGEYPYQWCRVVNKSGSGAASRQ